LDVDGKESFSFSLIGDEKGSVIDTLPKPKASYAASVPVHTQPPSRQAYS
jgi:hypothetical protein